MLKSVSSVVLAASLAISGCGPDTADREKMAAEMQAAAPDQIEGYHVNRGSLIDDASLDLYLVGNPSSEHVHILACDMLAPILRAHGDSELPVDLWLDGGYGKHLGEVRDICSTGGIG